jgi:hypothetical protein
MVNWLLYIHYVITRNEMELVLNEVNAHSVILNEVKNLTFKE